VPGKYRFGTSARREDIFCWTDVARPDITARVEISAWKRYQAPKAGFVTDDRVNQDEASSATSLSLLERARGQDQVAWERLVNLYSPLVDRWCREAGLQEADGCNVRQEVFLAVYRKLGDFRRDRPGDTFRGWLRTITHSKLVDHWRAAQTAVPGQGGSAALNQLLQVPAPEPDSSDRPADTAETNLLYRTVLDMVRHEFQENTWQAFWRVALEEQSPADVAADLQMSVNAVYLAKKRVLDRIRQEFRDLIAD
jgi:RNA polymerase sigma-70 factor (ECF subfamily)